MKYLVLLTGVILFAMRGHAQVPNYVPTAGLIGWWPFNGNANDESGNGHHGVVHGAHLTSDRFSKDSRAYLFKGREFIEVAGGRTINFTDSLTINCWFKNNEPFGNIYVSKHPSSSYNSSFVMYSESVNAKNLPCGPVNYITDVDNKVHFVKYSGFCDTTEWHMMTFVFNRPTLKMYIDGIIIDSVASIKSIKSTDNPILFGRSSEVITDSANAKGEADCKIDDIGMWNRALSRTEITSMFKSRGCGIATNSDSILGYRKVETHQVVTYALRNNPSLSYKWIATGGYMLGASTNHFCDVIWGYDKFGSVCCIVSDSTCSDTLCVTTTINNVTTGGIAGEVSDVPTMSVRPNPANEVIDISTALGENLAHYELIDVTGLVIQRTEGVQARMSVANIVPGVYHLVQRDHHGNVIGMQRVVVQR